MCKKYSPGKRAKTTLAKQVVDTLDDREVSRDRVVLQRIIDPVVIPVTVISISIFTARELIITQHRFDVLSLVIRGHSLM